MHKLLFACALICTAALGTSEGELLKNPEVKAAVEAARKFGIAVSKLPDGEKPEALAKACRVICSIRTEKAEQDACESGCTKK